MTAMTRKTRKKAISSRFSEPVSFWGLRYSVKWMVSTNFLARDHSPRAPEDCNAPDAMRPVPRHVKNHAWLPLPRHILNRLEHNGRRNAANARSGVFRPPPELP